MSRAYLVLLSLFLFSTTLARQITVINSCGTTIWPAFFTGSTIGLPESQANGWELASGVNTVFRVGDDWTAGRIWARTGCMIQDGRFQCLTGGCGTGENGNVEW
jgi:hypothetical protein